jgi:hypothetical protein
MRQVSSSGKAGHNGSWKIVALLFGFVLLLSNCSAPPPSKRTGSSLHRALFGEIGYQLGDDRVTEDAIDTGSCAVEGRYGDKKTSEISRIVCVDRSDASKRITYRLNFTEPNTGHLVWKIDATFLGRKVDDLDLIEVFEDRYGAPHRLENPLTLSWQLESASLSVREDQFGIHVQLWDRGLR